MFIRIVAVTFAVNFGILFASGFVIKAKLRILEPILKCYEDGENDDMGRPDSDAEVMKMVCLGMKGYDSCIADAIKAQPAPVPKVFNFYALIAYQTSYLYRRAHLCPKLTFERIKEIVEDSDILKEEGLSNIEDDQYEKCAGDALKKCTVKEMVMYEHDDDFEKDEYAFADCMEKQAKTCSGSIMRHIMGQMKAYKRHLKKLNELEEIEEKRVRAFLSRSEAQRAR